MQTKWWHGKVAYQIYPKSFKDTNGDGFGDLPGIIEKIPYLHDLGIDLLWISPIYKSPFADQGYDIADYQDIDPIFGSMDDFKKLKAEADKYGIGIIMDLVVNHCSDEHEWFKKACADPKSEEASYFIFREGKDGKVPNNLRACFGGSVWEPVPGQENLYYCHWFHKKQPDLNWFNPKLRQKIYDMMNWWLVDMGIAGFRVDAIMNIAKDLTFPGLPAVLLHHIFPVILRTDLADHPARVAACKYICRDIPDHHAPGRNDRIVPDRRPGHDRHMAADPDVIADMHRARIFIAGRPPLRVKGMSRRVDPAVRPDAHIIPEGHFISCKEHEIIVGEEILTKRHTAPEITVIGLFDPEFLPVLLHLPPDDLLPVLLLGRAQAVIIKIQFLTPLPLDAEAFFLGVIKISRQCFLFFCHDIILTLFHFIPSEKLYYTAMQYRKTVLIFS